MESIKWVRMKTFTIEKKGDKVRSVGIAEDITDWKNAEEELIKTKEGYALSDDLDTIEQNARQLIVLNEKLAASEKLLTELNSNKDRFFSIISHDLRNPFMGILGYSKMLAEESLDSEETQEISSKLYETSKNTYSLLENLLEWSLAQRNKIEFKPEIFPINEAVTEIFLLFKEKALKKNISLINKIGGDSFAYADFNMIKTVLRNLISNAIKFCKESGEISIEESYENDKIRISVCDNGIGIKNDDMAKLFRIDGRFTQEGTAGEKGTGLGLILSKEFVEKNSGIIWMESEFNKGTKIHFQLPVKPPEKPGLRNIILQR